LTAANVIIRASSPASPPLPREGEIAFVRRLRGCLSALRDGSVLPVGCMWFYPQGKVAPPGFLLCDGSAVSRQLFPQLFALIGTTYGAGDGALTFNLPDYRGAAPVPETVPPAQEIVNGTVTDPDVPATEIGGSGANVVTGARPGGGGSVGWGENRWEDER